MTTYESSYQERKLIDNSGVGLVGWQTSHIQPPLIPKPFKLGFMIGRFQHIHIGHEMVINTALNVCDKVILLVGSAQEKGTLRNPFWASKRIELIEKIYNRHTTNLVVDVIEDMTHENDHSHDWGRFVLARVAEVAHNKGIHINPDVMIYGNDEERQGWFDPEDIEHTSQLVITRGNIKISATKLREYIATNNFFKWRQFVNEKIHDQFDTLREELLKLPYYNTKENESHD